MRVGLCVVSVRAWGMYDRPFLHTTLSVLTPLYPTNHPDAASTTSTRDQIEVEQKFPLAQNDPQARAALDAAIRAQGGVLKVRLMYVGEPSRAIQPKPIK